MVTVTIMATVKKMLTEHHCHVLPRIDDGSKSVEMSLEMIGMMRRQGVGKIIATPHFYAHREESVNSYLNKRKKAFLRLTEADKEATKDIFLGAEVAIEQGISRLEGIERLEMAGTGFILLELPYGPFSPRYLEEIQEVRVATGFTPIIAHINRYLDYYSKKELGRVLDVEAVFQFNNEAFSTWGQRRFVKSLIKEGYPYIFGSDAHNISNRRPDWDILKAKVTAEILRGATSLFERE